MNLSLYQKIVDVLENVQKNTSSNQKFQIVLTNVFKKSQFKEFYDCLERILSILLMKDPKLKNIHVERVIQFWMTFCGTIQDVSDEGELLFESVLKFLLQCHNLHSEVVRFRVCQCLNQLLSNLMDAELKEEICGEIEEAMLERLEVDNQAPVRCQAICAVYRLQDALNKDCRIVTRLRMHMNSDPSSMVRKVCTEKIHINRDVLVSLVLRTRDINSNVRLAALKRLSILPKALKISERHSVLINGFSDVSKTNVQYVRTHFVKSWFNLYENDYFSLIHSLRLCFAEKDIEDSTKVIELIVNALLKTQSYTDAIGSLEIGEDHLVPLANLNWEVAIFWRLVMERLRMGKDLDDDSFAPEPVIFATYIRDYVAMQKTSPEFQFVLKELFTISQGFDVSDVISREVLTKVVLDMLKDVELHSSVILTIVNNLKYTIPWLENRIQVLSELVSDLLYSPQEHEEKLAHNFQIAELKVNIHDLDEKLRSAIQEEDYDNAALYKRELDGTKIRLDDLQKTVTTCTQVLKKTDAPTVIKCLNVTKALLVSTEIRSLNPVLRTLNEDIIMEFLTDNDLLIRDTALECFALCCLVDKKCAEKGISIFTSCIFANEIVSTNNVTTTVIAVKAICDLFVIYGQDLLDHLEDSEMPTISASQIIQSLVNLMDDENIDLKECAAKGLCNLIFYCRVQSPILVSRMILKWCNPALDDELEKVKQQIGMLLQKLPMLPGSTHLLENSFVPTIKTIVNAPKTSPLSDVNLPSLIKFMLSLCSVCQENDGVHCLLAFKILTEINDNFNEPVNLVLSKVLLLLGIKPDAQLITGLIKLCQNIIQEEDNNIILNNIEKFKCHIQSLSVEVPIIEEEIEE
ncbi:hypothetical protein FQR65_LT16086 [Abscondita terminalis]|nr:hypothetical protein FQR65_LT16086 [Abscondita terminalis]